MQNMLNRFFTTMSIGRVTTETESQNHIPAAAPVIDALHCSPWFDNFTKCLCFFA